MTTRFRTSTVTFPKPFRIAGVAGVHAAGNYEVETEEELLSGPSFPIWQRVAILLRLPPTASAPGLEQVVVIDAAALEASLQADAPAQPPAEPGLAAPLGSLLNESPGSRESGPLNPLRSPAEPGNPAYQDVRGGAGPAIGEIAMTYFIPPIVIPALIAVLFIGRVGYLALTG